jgi:nucleotide-binding universal stress UspA family protein
MAIKDLCVCVASIEADEPALLLAEQLARRHAAHLSCAAIGVLPMPVFSYSEYSAADLYQRIVEEGQRANAAFWAAAEARLQRMDLNVELRRLQPGGGDIELCAAMQARHADLIVARAPADAAPQPHMDIIEGALIGGGGPVLVVPLGWRGGTIGQKPLIAWDAGREAARALRDALPLFQPDAHVTVATIDAAPSATGFGDAPGHDVAAHLARHGLKVEVRNEDSLGRSVAQVVKDLAAALDADLIVMGGYRHARLQQALLGGVTRSLLRETKIPLLLSH